MKFTLDLNRWRCGQEGHYKLGHGHTELENGKGYQCCLGQFSLQLDKKCFITDISEPEDVVYSIPPEKNILLKKNNDIVKYPKSYINSDLSCKCIDINDNEAITIKQKIQRLTSVLKKYGHSLRVKNDKLFDSRGRLINFQLLINTLDYCDVENFVEGDMSTKEFEKKSTYARQLIRIKGSAAAKKILKNNLKRFDFA